MRLWHEQLPSKYSIVERFNHGAVARWPVQAGWKTLEIGAGLGAHSRFEDLMAQEYYCVEYRREWCAELENQFPKERIHCGDIQERQPWPNAFFDRVIAIHVLEHLRNLPLALEEILRVLKPEGVLDVVLPCEGGLAYSLARKLSAERLFRKRFGEDYTPIVRNEHVSTYREIAFELMRRFRVVHSRYFPWHVPLPSINLCVALRLVSNASPRPRSAWPRWGQAR